MLKKTFELADIQTDHYFLIHAQTYNCTSEYTYNGNAAN